MYIEAAQVLKAQAKLDKQRLSLKKMYKSEFRCEGVTHLVWINRLQIRCRTMEELAHYLKQLALQDEK